MSLVHRLNAFAARQVTMKPARLTPGQATASFTFDDFPRSAWTVGGKILERRGLRGTYYAAGSFCGRTVEGIDYYDEADLRAVAAAGHEIGGHSFSHAPAPDIPDPVLADDMARNDLFLQAVLGEDAAPFSYAHPYGLVCPRTKRLLGELYPSCRGIHPGLNGSTSDLSQLRAIPIESRSWRAPDIVRWIDAARAARAWIIFFTHDVSETPSPYGCTPAMLEHAVESVLAAGLSVAPVGPALSAALGRPVAA